MTLDELKERLPAYMFLEEKEKKEYFVDLNANYFEEMEKREKGAKEKKLNVDFSGNFKIRSKPQFF